MSGTGTRTLSSTFTFAEQVRKVTRPLQTDLLAIVDTFGHLSISEVADYVHDFRELMDERYLDHIELVWVSRLTGTVVDGLRYNVVNGEAVRAMDRPGGIQYDRYVAAAQFSVRIGYTALWRAKTDEYQKSFERGLRIAWGPAGSLNYGGGRYVNDGREYGQASVGVSRQRFERQ